MSGPETGSRRWQFHRLHPGWAARVVASADVGSGALVVDVGAGDGALTVPLLETGARVIAVELHPGRAAGLRAATDGRDVSVLAMDLADFTFPGRPCRVVANPPFGLAATLVRRIARSRTVRAADLVLPVDVVARWVRTGVRGAVLSSGLRVPRSAFDPYAPRPCAVLRLRRR